MSAPAPARPAVIPTQRITTSGKSRWPAPVPAARVWVDGQTPGPFLHRVPRWERRADNRMYAGCGVSAYFWFEPPGDGFGSPGKARKTPCPRCAAIPWTQ